MRARKQKPIPQMMIRQWVSVVTSLSFLREFTSVQRKGPSELEIDQLLSPLVDWRYDVLGYQQRDLYNLSVYLYNPENGLLEQYWRRCDDRLDARNRAWIPNQGHAGVAFAENAILIDPDAAKHPRSSKLFSFDDIDRDLNYYRSFMSVAISTAKNAEPIGVLTITSDRAGQFEKPYFELLCSSYRLILSIYLNASVC